MLEPPPVLNFEEIDYKEIEVEEVSPQVAALVGGAGKEALATLSLGMLVYPGGSPAAHFCGPLGITCAGLQP